MYERLLMIIVVFIFGYTTYLFLRRLQLQRAQSASIVNKGISFKTNAQHIVYFCSEGCSQCKNAQQPTLDRLMMMVNKCNVVLITVVVEENAELAHLWDVRTLPTIYVVDKQGHVSHVNNGFVSESSLIKQLNVRVG